GLFVDFLDDKPAHLADPHQMIEGQSNNNEEKHQRCAEESDKLESLSHAEMVSVEWQAAELGRAQASAAEKRYARGSFLLAQANSNSDGLAQDRSAKVVISQFAKILININVNSRGHFANHFAQACRFGPTERPTGSPGLSPNFSCSFFGLGRFG